MSPALPSACIRGCTIPDVHAGSCTCSADGHRHVEPHHPHGEHEYCDDECRWCDECTGCQPRPATVGRLCAPDVGRAQQALLGVGELVHWVRANVVPGTRRPGRDDVLRQAPAPLLEQAVDDADALHAVLTTFVVRYAQEVGLRGPDQAGGRILPASKRRLPGAHLAGCAERMCTGCAVSYDPARAAGLRAGGEHQATARLAAWMLGHFEGFAGRDWAGSWHDAITSLYGQVSGSWPVQDRVRKLPIPCRRCDRVMLFMHPPISGPIVERESAADGTTRERVVYAADFTVCCHSRDCGDVMTEADYYLRAQTLLAERQAGAR